MKLFLLLEGSDRSVSVSLADVDQGKILLTRSSESQSDMMFQLMDQVLSETGFSKAVLQGLAVNAGPGSYTGLRIVASYAKGICTGLNIPLYALSGLRALANEYYQRNPGYDGLVMCLLDARRDEVFAAAYQNEKIVLQPGPRILDDNFVREFDGHKKMVLIGSGAGKAKPFFFGKDIHSDESVRIDASSLLTELMIKLDSGQQENVAGFEPDYLKEFYLTISSKS